MIKDFVFNDIVLYAKGWYERSEDIVDDLSYLFSKIYAWTPKDEEEVATFMLKVMDAVYNECPDKNRGLYYFHQEIKRREWLYEVSYNRAIILWVMAELWDLKVDEIKLKAPHYGKKEKFRLGMPFGGKYPISMTYTSMTRIAEKAFGND